MHFLLVRFCVACLRRFDYDIKHCPLCNAETKVGLLKLI